MKIAVPELALILLVGPAGSGKSTFARAHFKPTEVISSDYCRALVSDNEGDQSSTPDAFELLHTVVRLRLRRGRLTVVDAVNARPVDRRPLLRRARELDCAAVAIVFDLPDQICVERDRRRPGRSVGERVIGQQREELRRSLATLDDEGFDQIYVFNTPEAVEEAVVKRTPLPVNRRWERGPLDVIGDVHGCRLELVELLRRLGYRWEGDMDGSSPAPKHPAGRKTVFVGDLVGGGPDPAGVLRLVMGMVESRSALSVRGDHDHRLLHRLQARRARPAPGLELFLAQVVAEPALKSSAVPFLESLPSHYVFDRGALVVTHAGIKSWMVGRDSPRVRRFSLNGDMTGEARELGPAVDPAWARSYAGRAIVVYGHTPVPEARWARRTINIDTGCVFGGRLTALRYPEMELVSVPAARAYELAAAAG